MKLQFDANQEYQLAAVAAVTDLFAGQSGGQYAEDKLRENARIVQARGGIPADDPSAPLAAWELLDAQSGAPRRCPHFVIEMETGTGKTYVYLRTIFELSQRYGFRKFIIVVPSVAIREGVLKNIAVTAAHFRALYNNPPFEYSVYDGQQLTRLRHFALGSTLQILIMNIDAFRKNFSGYDEERQGNVIYKENDKLSGRRPIEFIQGTRPIVIIDEPQSVDTTDRAQAALRQLNPLCTLRYSATHRDLYNLVYRLDPVRAFELRLVKQVVVASAAADPPAHEAFVRVERIDYQQGIRAMLTIRAQKAGDVQEKRVTVRVGADLYRLSNGCACYAAGFVLSEIYAEPGQEYIRFSNGRVLRQGEELGGVRADLWRAQIRHTVKKHLEKALQLKERGVKVLSLFFVDRVASYRSYDDAGRPVPGRFAAALEEALADLGKESRYAPLTWLALPPERLHNGYFAADKAKRVWKDTRGDTQADDEVYALIMQDKERLLSEAEPLRFIFSHSALREGWDNPNVFQICTLNETRSAVKKRQEIGRGLRLPVDQDGRRVCDEAVNQLTVVANESYDAFARALQAEYQEDCGVTFSKAQFDRFVQSDRGGGMRAALADSVLDPEFSALWERIRANSTYRIEFSSDGFVRGAVAAIKGMAAITAPKIRVSAGRLSFERGRTAVHALSTAVEELSAEQGPIPDILTRLQNETPLTRATLLRILSRCGRLAELCIDPERFTDCVARLLKQELRQLLVNGVQYAQTGAAGAEPQWEMILPKHREPMGEIEQAVQLPYWFEIDTPVGKYRPKQALYRDERLVWFFGDKRDASGAGGDSCSK